MASPFQSRVPPKALSSPAATSHFFTMAILAATWITTVQFVSIRKQAFPMDRLLHFSLHARSDTQFSQSSHGQKLFSDGICYLMIYADSKSVGRCLHLSQRQRRQCWKRRYFDQLLRWPIMPGSGSGSPTWETQPFGA